MVVTLRDYTSAKRRDYISVKRVFAGLEVS